MYEVECISKLVHDELAFQNDPFQPTGVAGTNSFVSKKQLPGHVTFYGSSCWEAQLCSLDVNFLNVFK